MKTELDPKYGFPSCPKIPGARDMTGIMEIIRRNRLDKVASMTVITDIGIIGRDRLDKAMTGMAERRRANG